MFWGDSDVTVVPPVVQATDQDNCFDVNSNGSSAENLSSLDTNGKMDNASGSFKTNVFNFDHVQVYQNNSNFQIMLSIQQVSFCRNLMS